MINDTLNHCDIFRLKELNILDNISEAIRYCDNNLRVIWANRAALESAGKTLDEIRGRFCYEIWQNRDEPCMDCPAIMSRETGEPKSAEIVSRVTGKIYFIRAYPERDESGKLIGILEFLRDITKEREIEKKLRDDELKYRSIFENNLYAMALCDLETFKFIDINESFFRLYGYPREELLNLMSFFDLFSSEIFNNFKINDFSDNESIYIPLSYHKRKNGSLFPVEISGKRFIISGKKVLSLIIKDITQEIDIKIREQEITHQLKTLMDSLPGYAFFKDKDLKYITASKKLCDALKIKPDDLKGKSDFDFFPIDLALKYRADDRRVLNGEMEMLETEEEVCFEGNYFFVSTRKVIVKDNKGDTVGLIGLGFDITERKKIEERLSETNTRLEEAIKNLNEMAKKAEEASRAKGEFLAKMSHEIRTPLNGILGITELLLGLDLTEKQSEYVRIIQGSGEILSGIINDILDFSKIEAGKVELERVEFDIFTTVKSSVDMMFHKALEKGLDLNLSIDENIHRYLVGDPLRLRQILINLIGNAIKFSIQGQIIVKAELQDRYEKGVKIRFSVMDSGVGIPSDKIPYLFQPFIQIDSSTSRKFGGTGLGLAISKELVGMMGGEMGCYSVVGEGSTFWFTALFDIAENYSDRESPSSIDQEMQKNDISGVKILVAEDNSVNQIVISEILRKFGFDVTVVQNGEEAIKTLKNGIFNLILMDCEMPVLDGFEATKRIRLGYAGESVKSIPIIAITAYATMEDQKKCIDSGMNDYLTKPIRPDKLKNSILTWIGNPNNNYNIHSKPISEDKRTPSLKGVFQEESVFDWDLYIQNVMMQEDLARKGIKIFLDTIPEQLDRLKNACNEMNFKEIQVISHKIKGSAGLIGAKRIHKLLIHLEDAAKKMDSHNIKELIGFLDENFEILKLKLEKYL